MKKTCFLAVCALLAAALTAQSADLTTIRAGGGIDGAWFAVDQQTVSSSDGATYDFKLSGVTAGLGLFADLTPYFTLKALVRIPVGSLTESNWQSTRTDPWFVTQYEVDFEGKYPFILQKGLVLSPKGGLSLHAVPYFIIGSSYSVDPDTLQQFSPIDLLAGADLDWYISGKFFVRGSLDGRWALNSRLSDGYYTAANSESYKGSSNVDLHVGVFTGYQF